MSHHTIDLANVKAIVAEIVASHDVKSVAFVGCGASSSELYPGYYFLKDAARTLRPFHFTASEFNQDTPAWVDESAAVITCSLGGTTPEAVEANHVAKSLGATVIAVTHVAGSALTEEADYSIVHGFELNYAAKIEKMGYVIALAVELLQQTEGYEHYDAMLDGFDRIFDLAESAANHAKGFAADFGRQFKDDPLIYYMSLTRSVPLDEYVLTVPASRVLDADPATMAPTGERGVAGTDWDWREGRLMGATATDNAYTGLPEGTWRVRLRGGEGDRAVVMSAAAPWVQVYSGEHLGRRGVAVEPMTCPPDAFNSGTDLVTLAVGESHVFSCAIREED